MQTPLKEETRREHSTALGQPLDDEAALRRYRSIMLTLLSAIALAQPAPQETTQVNGREWRKVDLTAGVDGGAPSTAAVWIYEPPNLRPEKPIVLGLPGWKFAAMTWEEHAGVAALAEQHGVAVALADMHITIYESAFYPETVAAYKWCGPECTVPGLRWVGEVILPWLTDSYTVAGAFGLSTGGRGAVLAAQAYQGIPRACSISGTFDLFSLTEGGGEYRIHEVVYGSRAAHPERWRADDSLARIDELKGTEVLLIHGAADGAVPPAQSQALAAAPGVTVSLVDGGGHDWALWKSQAPACFAFLAPAKDPTILP